MKCDGLLRRILQGNAAREPIETQKCSAEMPSARTNRNGVYEASPLTKVTLIQE